MDVYNGGSGCEGGIAEKCPVRVITLNTYKASDLLRLLLSVIARCWIYKHEHHQGITEFFNRASDMDARPRLGQVPTHTRRLGSSERQAEGK